MSESHPSSPDRRQDKITADIRDIPFRTPIIADEDWRSLEERVGSVDWSQETNYKDPEATAGTDREWRLLSEIARRAILSDPSARHVAAEFIDKPVSEALAGQAIEALADQNDNLKRVAATSARSVISLLRLPEVPDELLGNSIRYAPPLEGREDTRQILNYHLKRGDDEAYAAALQAARKNDKVHSGISKSQKRLVANRYSYGRDIKLLALMAELQDEPVDFHKTDQQTLAARLASGTTLEMTEEAAMTTPQLLNPDAWQSRTQLKDRVYTIRVGGREAILKERKTNRHTDILTAGFSEGLTSKQEFDLTHALSEQVIQYGDIALRWEKPLGYVEFPDGFQFAVFEKEPDLTTYSPEPSLKKAIQENPEKYEEEYTRIKAAAKAIYHQRTDLIREYSEQEALKKSRGWAITLKARQRLKAHQKALSEQPPIDELTFEEFATLKARSLMIQAQDMQVDVVHKLGYEPGDDTNLRDNLRNGAFKVYAMPGERVKLEFIGFDLEYYKPEKGEEAARHIQKDKESGAAAIEKITLFHVPRGAARAASFALMKDIGYKLPPKTS